MNITVVQGDLLDQDVNVIVKKISRIDQELVVNFEGRAVEYDFGDLDDYRWRTYCRSTRARGRSSPAW